MYKARPVPPGIDAPTRTVAPSRLKSVTEEEVAPIFASPDGKQMSRRTTPNPRKRRLSTFPTGDPPINVKKWDVDPNRIAHDLGLG